MLPELALTPEAELPEADTEDPLERCERLHRHAGGTPAWCPFAAFRVLRLAIKAAGLRHHEGWERWQGALEALERAGAETADMRAVALYLRRWGIVRCVGYVCSRMVEEHAPELLRKARWWAHLTHYGEREDCRRKLYAAQWRAAFEHVAPGAPSDTPHGAAARRRRIDAAWAARSEAERRARRREALEAGRTPAQRAAGMRRSELEARRAMLQAQCALLMAAENQ